MSKRTRGGLLALLVIGTLLAASCAGGPSGLKPAAASGAIRTSDVPAGWARCGWSGSISHYLPLARKEDAASARSVQQSWTAQRKVGAEESTMTGYVAEKSDCSSGIGRTPGASAVTWTIAYASTEQAHRGYEAGVLGFPTPDASRIQVGLQVGASTGLGVDSWTLTQTSPAPSLFLAWWRQRSLTNLLVVAGLPSTDANPIALRVDAHMTG